MVPKVACLTRGSYVKTGLAVFIFVLFSLVFYIGHSSLGNQSVLLVPKDFQYGIMIDAGSSGSRVYLYRWPPHSGELNELLKIEQMKDSQGSILVQKTSPGLSAYATNPLESYLSLIPLLRFATENIPADKHSETPLYILCTAGMRLLSEEQRNNIINIVHTKIEQEFKFYFKHNHVEVIDGRMEGVYGWIAVNYMLGKFNHNDNVIYNEERPTTVGALDMGGASTQITYEVPRSEALPAELTMDIDLGCRVHGSQKSHTYHLYSTTYLSYGANEARKRYIEKLLENNKELLPHGNKSLSDPCLPKGMEETIASHLFSHVTLKGTGNFTECRTNIFPLLNLPSTCPRSPCAMEGKFQPPINFYQQEMYGFSEYWYTMDDILHIGGSYKEQKFIEAAQKFCGSDWRELSDRYERGEFPNADQHRFQYQCFKSAWVLAVLHDGHHFPSNYNNFQSAKTVNKEIVQWTYGAMLYKTRYLPLRAEGVDKEMFVAANALYSYVQWALVLCFMIVLLAIVYWVRRISLLQRHTEHSLLPTSMKDLSVPRIMPFTKPSRMSPVRETPVYSINSALPRTFSEPRLYNELVREPRTFTSDSLLTRDMGHVRVPIMLGDQ